MAWRFEQGPSSSSSSLSSLHHLKARGDGRGGPELARVGGGRGGGVPVGRQSVVAAVEHGRAAHQPGQPGGRHPGQPGRRHVVVLRDLGAVGRRARRRLRPARTDHVPRAASAAAAVYALVRAEL